MASKPRSNDTLDNAALEITPSRDEILLGYCAVDYSGRSMSQVYDTEQEVIESLRGFDGYAITPIRRILYTHLNRIWDIPPRKDLK